MPLTPALSPEGRGGKPGSPCKGKVIVGRVSAPHRQNPPPTAEAACPLTPALSPKGRGGKPTALALPIGQNLAQTLPAPLTPPSPRRGEGENQALHARKKSLLGGLAQRHPPSKAAAEAVCPLIPALSSEGRGGKPTALALPIGQNLAQTLPAPLTPALSPEGRGGKPTALALPIGQNLAQKQPAPLTPALSPEGRGGKTGLSPVKAKKTFSTSGC